MYFFNLQIEPLRLIWTETLADTVLKSIQSLIGKLEKLYRKFCDIKKDFWIKVEKKWFKECLNNLKAPKQY